MEMKKSALSDAGKVFGALVGSAALALGLAACSPSSAESAEPAGPTEPAMAAKPTAPAGPDGAAAPAAPAAPTAPTAEVGEGTIVLDVRTPEEYATGYLKGAKLLDFNGGQLAAELSSLDPDAEYLIYCRSGNRSTQAISLMRSKGFEKLTNLGSLEQASEAMGLPILGQ